eukprot:2642231-Alexandrium_andersonii.AAC.1
MFQTAPLSVRLGLEVLPLRRLPRQGRPSVDPGFLVVQVGINRGDLGQDVAEERHGLLHVDLDPSVVRFGRGSLGGLGAPVAEANFQEDSCAVFE